MENTEPIVDTNKVWWKPGPFGWFVVLLFASVGVLLLTTPLSRQDIAWTVYSLDPRTWPTAITYVLWLMVLLKIVHWYGGLDTLQKTVALLIVVAVLLLIVFMSQEMMSRKPVGTQYRMLSKIYYQLVLGPWTQWMDRGVWSWKILIAPALAAGTIAYLIRLVIQQRRRPKS